MQLALVQNMKLYTCIWWHYIYKCDKYIQIQYSSQFHSMCSSICSSPGANALWGHPWPSSASLALIRRQNSSGAAFLSANWNLLRTRTDLRVGAAFSPSQTLNPQEKTILIAVVSCCLPDAPQVHIDHGGAVLKWAEGISEKAWVSVALNWLKNYVIFILILRSTERPESLPMHQSQVYSNVLNLSKLWERVSFLLNFDANQEFKNDVLIVAGDLGDTFNAIKRGLGEAA